ncbi:MAG: 23S rRNA (guanosine(2251)-2'-O)-methyltransferase RlmB [Bacilli bacterium]|nr:23S rRNA (guanosine(2251)-2'-O)-methyltransferase RlmB [Bacilli bacterium]
MIMLVYGRNVAKEILNSDKKVEKIIIQEDFKDEMIISLIEKRKIRPQTMSKKEFSRFDKYSHQGIILYIEDFKYAELEDFIYEENAKVVILDHLEDPHNLGAIIRTCEAAGINGIIIPKDRSVGVNSTVMKTSTGALENVNLAMVTNLNQTIKKLKDNGFWIVGTDMEDSIDYREIDYSGKIALVIGSEGFGMSESVKKSCDFIARIPMNGKVNSLNASVAAGIMIYEVIRSNK